MAEPEQQTDFDVTALAELLSMRIEVIAAAADEGVSLIERDRGELGTVTGSAAEANELIDVVVERVVGVAAECRRLTNILSSFKALAAEQAAQGEGTGASVVDSGPEDPPAAETVDPESGPPTPTSPGPSEQSSQSPRVSEGIRLLATQMSVAGASNDEIARRLRDDFAVEDADRLIAELFDRASTRG